MNIKQLQNMMYSSAKQYVVNKSISFAIDFDKAVKTIYSKYEADNMSLMTDELAKYFISIGAVDIVRNNFVDFKYNEDLYKKLDETIKSVSKIEQLSEDQCYIIACIVTDRLVSLEDIKNANNIDIDINTVNKETFISSFNGIIEKQDITSILNFIQVNGLQYVYKAQLQQDKEPIMIFKFIYDVINNDSIKAEFSNFALSNAFYNLAISTDDEQLKQNCKFLSDEKIEFPVKDNSTIVISKFKQFNIDLQVKDKKISTVNDLFTTIIKNENFASGLKDEEIDNIKKKLLEALKDATKTLNAVLGFPDIIKGDNLTANEILNLTISKTVLDQQFNKKFIELIEIFFKQSDVNLYKQTKIFDSLYDGVYQDFKEVFDEDINPSIDTGYKMTENVDLFWESVVKLQDGLNDNNDIKDCFQKFGETVFNCDNYMITLKMLFTFFYNVSGERTPYMTILYICATMTGDIFGNTWSTISSGIKQGLKNLI